MKKIMKKMMKILATTLAVVMTLPAFSSCIIDGGESSAPQGGASLVGEIKEETYVNEYFDISLTLPAHWYFASEEAIETETLTFFSDRTEEEKKKSGFSVACRAENTVTEDVIEISVEKMSSEYYLNGWRLDMWESRSGYFNGKPDTLEGGGYDSATIGDKTYDGRGYVAFLNGEAIGRLGLYYTNINEYILCITIISGGFFGEDSSFNKNNAMGRMTDWFGTASVPSTSMNAEGGGYYLNDIMAPSMDSDMLYAQYDRNQPFTIAGKTYYDCIPLDNGNSFGVGKQKDVVYYLDGTTYKEFSFTTGVKDQRITVGTSPDEYVAFEILLDGKQVFEERQYAFAKEQTFKVDITGAKKMVIRVRDNWELTSCVIADPVISTEPRNVEKTVPSVTGSVDFLDAVEPFYTSQSIDVLYGDTNENFEVAGKEYSKGIILRDAWGSSSQTYFNLGGKYKNFNFHAGIIKDTLYSNGGWLNIYLDGVKILDVELEFDCPTQSYSLDVTDGHILCIECTSGIDYGIHQGDFALYNMTLGEPVVEKPKDVEPGSYKLISEIGLPFSSKASKVYDGSTKFRGHYMGDVFYNEGIAMESIYSFIGSPIEEALPAKASFNLGGQFKYLTFTVGRVDKSHVKDDVLVVYGDGKELARYELTATAFPKSYELNVEGVDVLQFSLLGFAGLTRGTYMVADIGVHTHEIGELDFNKPEEKPFPDSVGLMERFLPYEYMSAEGNGHDAIRYFNGIYDGTDNKSYFMVDGVKYTRGFVLSTSVYLSLDSGGLLGAGVFGVAGFVGGGLALLALATSSEVSQASFACFNLHGQYKTLVFNVGVVDGQNYVDNRQQPYDKFYVIADDKIVGEYRLTSDMETMQITVDIANCERLAFWLDHNRNSPSYAIFDSTITK